MHIPHVLAAGLDVVVDGVGRDGADLHEPVVLDEDGVARQVAVDDRRHASMEVAGDDIPIEINKHDLLELCFFFVILNCPVLSKEVF